MGSIFLAWLALPSFGGLWLAGGFSATSQFGVKLLSVANTIGWTVLAGYVILNVIGVVNGPCVNQQGEIKCLGPEPT